MIQLKVEGTKIQIETDAIQATIQTEGYTSGVAAGSFVDKKTGARDTGFGLSIVDFLLEPGDANKATPAGQYHFGDPFHGAIPKRYVEGPQICTQAKKLAYQIARGPDFVAVRLSFQWHQAYAPYQAGSRWEQTLVFMEKSRWFLSADRVTSVNDVDSLFLRIDMPGHVKHRAGDTFEHVYLSYEGDGLIPSSEFLNDFPPDRKFLYQRRAKPPRHMIRGYQLAGRAEPGPWLAGITLDPADVHEAWCHQRGYICFIEEVGGRRVRKGETFGAAYAVGWFEDPAEMHATAEILGRASGIVLDGPRDKPTSYRLISSKQLTPVGA